jgi:hypothetical protein
MTMPLGEQLPTFPTIAVPAFPNTSFHYFGLLDTETSGTTHPTAQRGISADLNRQHHLPSRVYAYLSASIHFALQLMLQSLAVLRLNW